MKFKVGDKVKIVKKRTIKMANLGSMDKYLGKIMTIARIDGDWYKMKEDEGEWYWNDDMIEGLVQFTKSDLKDGDIITYRNKEKRTLKKNRLIDEKGDVTNNLSQYRNDLTEKNDMNDLDIIKVERPVKYETVYECKEILDEAERRYLRDVIRPFRDKVGHIKKQNFFKGDYITINVKHDNGEEGIDLPYFNKNTMYKRMEAYRRYTLEELRTIKE